MNVHLNSYSEMLLYNVEYNCDQVVHLVSTLTAPFQEDENQKNCLRRPREKDVINIPVHVETKVD